METITRSVELEGMCQILFDRYAGDNNEVLPWMKKVYTDAENNLVLPALNLMSFLSSQGTESAPKRVCGKRWLTVAKTAQSFVTIEPFEVPFLRRGKKIKADASNLKCVKHVARVQKGRLSIPSPKERPMLDLPWSIAFKIHLMETPELREEVLRRLFEEGGIAIGLGTFRGVFGKFKVSKWE